MSPPLAVGAALDAEVYRKVMGGHTHLDRHQQPYWCRTLGPLTDCDRHWGRVDLPQFSQDWTAMGVLVAHRHSQGWHLRLWYDEDLACWACRFYRRGAMHEWSEEQHADTAPAVVALASLQTVGGDR